MGPTSHVKQKRSVMGATVCVTQRYTKERYKQKDLPLVCQTSKINKTIRQNQQSKSIRSWRKCMASFLQIQRMMKIFNTHNRSGRLGGLMFSFKRVQKSLFSNGLALYWPYWLVSCWPLHQIMLIVFWFHLVQDVEKVTLVWQEEDVGFLSGKPSQSCM